MNYTPLHNNPKIQKMDDDELWLYYSDLTDEHLYSLSETKALPNYLLEIVYFSRNRGVGDPFYIGFGTKTQVLDFLAEVHFGSSSPLHGRPHLDMVSEGYKTIQGLREKGDLPIDLNEVIEQVNQMLNGCSSTLLVSLEEVQFGMRPQDRFRRSEYRKHWGVDVHDGPFDHKELQRYMPLFY